MRRGPLKTAYEIFKLMESHSRGMLLSVASECLKKKVAEVEDFSGLIRDGTYRSRDSSASECRSFEYLL